MYEYVSGNLIRKSPAEAVVDVGGVGYRLRIPLTTYEAIGSSGPVKLLCHHHVREDIAQLFGFATESERAVFRMLISVSRIGPGVAIGIISSTPADRLVRAIESEDTQALEAIKGIGKKMAQRLVVELKESVQALALQLGSAGAAGPLSPIEVDAVLALTALGYNRAAAQKAVEKAKKISPAESVAQLVKQALQFS